MHAEPQLKSQLLDGDRSGSWRAFALVVVLVAAVIAVFWPTVQGMIAIWNRSETFTHGWLVFPAFLWLAWERRQRLAAIVPRPFWPGLVFVVGGGFVWLVSNVVGINVLQQLAVIGLVAACMLTVYGWRFSWELAFPLAFLFFAVPMGEALIPPMMEMTADFTVAALRLTGVPVYREGLFFVIPSGNWSIVEGCSGLRYLIASVTVGCIFAYLYYRSIWRRLAFIGMSILVPIVANWMRAYIIVMLGHLSGNRIAAGADHLIYGWVFFGFVMLLLFWVGARWREDTDAAPADSRVGKGSITVPGANLRAAGTAALLTLLAIAVWPTWAAYLDHRADTDTRAVELTAPKDTGGWQRQPEQATDWRPRYSGATASVFETYANGDRRVVLYLAVYRNQKQDRELINSQNIMIQQKHRVWSNFGESYRAEKVGAELAPVRETRLRSPQQRLLIWDWFVISGQDISNAYVAKLLQARDELLGRGDDGAAIIIAAPFAETTDQAEQTLRDFIAAMRGAVDASVASAFSSR